MASETALTYRPDIDGLRAVAVMAVVLYHAGFGTFSGGFVGVDVFFVISGYLITRLLARQVESTGKIDVFDFYLRRLRRIFPALLVTLAATTVCAVLVFSPQRLQAYGGSLLHAVYSVSNLFFFHESGYFDSDSGLKPLLHTWSLGVEEQFYLVWPFLVLLAGTVVRRQFLVIASLGLAGALLAVAATDRNPSAAFFLMPFRVFEFSMGAVLVVLERRKSSNGLAHNLLFLAGLSLIAWSVLAYSKDTPFPGAAAILPCLGAVLCIHSGNRAGAGRLLQGKAVVGLGLISYSLYLVHWPVVVFYRYCVDLRGASLLGSWLIVLSSLGLAAVMYVCVEKRFRRNRASNRRFLVGLGAAVLVLSYAGASMWAADGWKWRPWIPQSISLSAIEKGKNLRFAVRQDQCTSKGWDHCDDLRPGAVNALIIGDSHAPDALNAFSSLHPLHNYAMSSLGGCPPHADIASVVSAAHPDLPACRELNLGRHDAAYLKRFDYVVVNVLFGWYTYDHLAEYLRFLKRAGVGKVVVFGGYLTMSEELPELINRFGYSDRVLDKYIQARSDDSDLRSVVEELGYLFVSKMDRFCVDGECALYDADRVPFTYDMHHLSYDFSVRMLEDRAGDVSDYLDRPAPEPDPSPDPGPAVAEDSFRVLGWGPQSARIGSVPNRQPGGNMGIWIKFDGDLDPEGLDVLVGAKTASSTVLRPGLVTAGIDPSFIDQDGPASYEVAIGSHGRRLHVGSFSVLAASADEAATAIVVSESSGAAAAP